MAKFLTWALCLFMLAAAAILASVHTVTTRRIDGSTFVIVVGCVLLIAVIGTDHDNR